jgi:taurine dioxygenase
MSYKTLTVTPLTPSLGGVISGVDLTRPLSEEQVAEINAALIDRHVIFFRDQTIDFAAHKALAEVFGPIHIAPSTKAWRVPGFDEITRMHADADSKYVAGEDWHSDMTCDPEPPLGSVLYLHTLPPLGGDTIFANMHQAYEALSDRMKAYLEGLTAVHDGARVFGRIAPPGSTFPISTHPVVRTHPVTGRKALFVNKEFSASINDLPHDEGEALLQFLVRHAQKVQFQCRFVWTPNTIAIWDNRSLQHIAIWDYFPHVRSGYRITIKGDKPF